MDEDVDPREAARIRRRDRDVDAEARALMRPGMGKVFKQILDVQRRAADAESAPERGAPPKPPTVRRRRPPKKP
jgi:hypothetical protein